MKSKTQLALAARLIAIPLTPALAPSLRRTWKLRDKANDMPGGMRKTVLLACIERRFQSYGSWIGPDALIHGMPFFPHGLLGVFISNGAMIGRDCTIYQQVTIGSNSLESSRGFGSPRVGDGCTIGAGAKIIGGIQIGDDCRIGANCVVASNVPPSSTVVSAPVRIIQRSP